MTGILIPIFLIKGGKPMTINQLQYYVEIVCQKSFTRAAESLFVSQSALSKSVRTLEQELKRS